MNRAVRVPRPRRAALLLAVVLGVATAAGAGCRTAPRAPAAAGDSTTMRPAREVIEAHAPELMKIPGVVGVYEGETKRGAPCIRVMVEKRTRDLEARLPDRLEGYPVEIEESGPIRPMGG